MSTYEAALRDVTSKAVIEAAHRFTCGDVPNQNRTFAPSIAEFVTEARRIAALLPYRDMRALPAAEGPRQDSPHAQMRMRLKMPLWKHAMATGQLDRLNSIVAGRPLDDMDELMALAQEWGVPIPDELWSMSRG